MSGAQGTTMQSWAWISSDGLAGWHVVGSRDFDGNGSPDVVWQNDGTRQATVWFMGGAQGNTMTNWAWVTTSSSVAGWTLIVR
jgi:hypothetical protein